MDWPALITPPLIWATAVWVSPYLKTHRPTLAGVLALISSALMFASLRLDDPAFPIFLGMSGVALTGMFGALFWPTTSAGTKQNAR
ncbi:hypothetical protein M0208_14365 [Sphingomonas sp. SUN019]|uniref:hypothetical protein n=1 Tax=Sphingomonas sp. SUN019 TaxID=2937788 RepID=UPI0021646282|nr:hypothetical protein [Sphingomonas sp. SUN019]UVO51631.1 hypothetical protein M0208_14365 [Sphingomonas sp. SUN019]